MSSNGGNRKSMEDVLSSIKRIIGSDGRETGDEARGDAPGEELPPLKLGEPVGGAPAGGQDEPPALSLTPNMRADRPAQDSEEEPSEPLPLGQFAAEPAPRPEPAPAAAPMGESEEDAVVIDEAALEDMIRRIVREELASALAEDEATDDRMRRVVQDELMGETGQTISRNVQHMIRLEVERLLRERDL